MMIGRAARGFVAGVAGTLTMAGAALVVRRMVEPGAVMGKTHYESVVEWIAGLDGEQREIEQADRIRAGEMLHLAFGGFWGAVFSLFVDGERIHPFTHGVAYGLSLWAVAFGGYMPALGISRSLAEMDTYERSRTLIAHLAFAIGTLGTLKHLRRA